MRKHSPLTAFILAGISLVLAGLACNMPGAEPSPQDSSSASDLSGPETAVLTQVIDPEGGVIRVDDPESPLDGFEIDIPADAYAAEVSFSISYQDADGLDLGPHYNPASPLIQVENGGEYAADLLKVTIPVEVPADHFAVGLFYDPETGEISGMTPLAGDEHSITVGTRHFSTFVVSIIAYPLLAGDFDTGFKVGVDDWQFANYGSFVAPGGHCAGQTLSMMHYYLTKGSGLYGKYDNFGSPLGKTKTFWQDDEIGYRLASTAQKYYEDNFYSTIYWRTLDANASHQRSFYTFAYLFLMTGEPQYVAISNDKVGHAMVAYAKKGNTLWIADPNYPGQQRNIVFDEAAGQFLPYSSGANVRDTGKSFPHIFYVDKEALLDSGTLARLWGQLEAGTVGDDVFPDYTLKIQEPSENGLTPKVPLEASYETEEDTIFVSIETDEIPRLTALKFMIDDWWPLETVEGTADGVEIPLEEGPNEIGILVEAMTEAGDKAADNEYGYVDFVRTKVTYNPPDLVNFSGQWDSGPLCDEAFETRYKWQVSLTQSESGAVNGTIRFHDCPGGGQTAYHVTGQVQPGNAYVIVHGTLTGGAGDLYKYALDSQYFLIRRGQKPTVTAPPTPVLEE